MNPNLNDSSTNDLEQDTPKTRWDNIIDDLNWEYPDESRRAMMSPQIASTRREKKAAKRIREEKKDYQKLGEKLIPKLTKAAKEATGVRDGQDLGEMLQEKASWDQQVEEVAEEIGRFISDTEAGVHENAEKDIKSMDLMSCEYGDEIYRRNLEERKLPMEVRKQRWFDENLPSKTLTPFSTVRPPEVVSYEALVYIAAGMDAPKVEDPDGRRPEDLKNAAIALYLKKVLGDKEALEKIQDGAIYKMIQRAIEVWRANEKGEYVPSDEKSDFRQTTLYKDVAKILSRSEAGKPFGE